MDGIKTAEVLKKGDLFYTSWGYDQTNYDYIVVLEVSKTGKTAKCQRTAHLNMGHESQCDVQEPIFCPFGEIFTMQVRRYDWSPDELRLKGSYPFLHTGIGDKRLDSFSRAKIGQQFHQTDAYSGH